MNWFLFTLKNINFYSRARRKEFIMFSLFNLIFSFISFVPDYLLNISLFNPIYYTLMFIPNLSLLVRRFHDLDLSAWSLLLLLIPIINVIVFILLMTLSGTVGPNRYGDDPKQQIAE
ncbi:DUF805 domain-containing protein [Avibacterium avium]|uniref:DUF805 domain-containing protein n=1 Tax=Avibacterium avium TaxID=751 RepID=UPI003BF8BF9A